MFWNLGMSLYGCKDRHVKQQHRMFWNMVSSVVDAVTGIVKQQHRMFWNICHWMIKC